MNDKTLVSVQCYLGDVGRVLNNLCLYLHHAPAPVIILSPEDSPVIIPGLVCRQAQGCKAGYIGTESLDRQRACLRILLEYPFDWYLLNDSDSFCVSPEIPKILYADKGMFWSNELTDPRTHPTDLPRLAFQAPYFFSRDVLERLIWVCDEVKTNPITPYIDHFMMQLVYKAGLRHRRFMEIQPYVMRHPVKTLEEATALRNDYIRYER